MYHLLYRYSIRSIILCWPTIILAFMVKSQSSTEASRIGAMEATPAGKREHKGTQWDEGRKGRETGPRARAMVNTSALYHGGNRI